MSSYLCVCVWGGVLFVSELCMYVRVWLFVCVRVWLDVYFSLCLWSYVNVCLVMCILETFIIKQFSSSLRLYEMKQNIDQGTALSLPTTLVVSQCHLYHCVAKNPFHYPLFLSYLLLSHVQGLTGISHSCFSCFSSHCLSES